MSMRQKWSDLVRRLTPPGYDASVELGWLAVGGMIAFITSLGGFGSRLNSALSTLRMADRLGNLRYPTMMMPYFAEILGGALWSFVILAVIALLLIPVHAGYWYQGSRSIYLMRRLPQRGELLRRTAGLPVLIAAAALAAALALLLVYFAIYCLVTPDAKQPDGQWAELMRVWFERSMTI